MNYNTSHINDALRLGQVLSQVMAERSALHIKINRIKTELDKYSTASLDLTASLTYIKADIENAEAHLPGLPESPFRNKMETDLLRNRLKLNPLQKQTERHSPYTHVQRQFELKKLAVQIVEMDIYTSKLSSRRIELQENQPKTKELTTKRHKTEKRISR